MKRTTLFQQLRVPSLYKAAKSWCTNDTSWRKVCASKSKSTKKMLERRSQVKRKLMHKWCKLEKVCANKPKAQKMLKRSSQIRESNKNLMHKGVKGTKMAQRWIILNGIETTRKLFLGDFKFSEEEGEKWSVHWMTLEGSAYYGVSYVEMGLRNFWASRFKKKHTISTA